MFECNRFCAVLWCHRHSDVTVEWRLIASLASGSGITQDMSDNLVAEWTQWRRSATSQRSSPPPLHSVLAHPGSCHLSRRFVLTYQSRRKSVFCFEGRLVWAFQSYWLQTRLLRRVAPEKKLTPNRFLPSWRKLRLVVINNVKLVVTVLCVCIFLFVCFRVVLFSIEFSTKFFFLFSPILTLAFERQLLPPSWRQYQHTGQPFSSLHDFKILQSLFRFTDSFHDSSSLLILHNKTLWFHWLKACQLTTWNQSCTIGLVLCNQSSTTWHRPTLQSLICKYVSVHSWHITFTFTDPTFSALLLFISELELSKSVCGEFIIESSRVFVVETRVCPFQVHSGTDILYIIFNLPFQ